MNPYENIKWIEERHDYYCGLAHTFMWKYCKHGKVFLPPKPVYISKAIKRAGQARLRELECQYNLAYAFNVEYEFEQTIAHEIAHHVSWQLSLDFAYHGDAFKLVLGVIFGRPAKKYHNYSYSEDSVELGKAILQMRELNSDLKELELV
jgi:predicted SprT family Zn-dependent metalloprotease